MKPPTVQKQDIFVFMTSDLRKEFLQYSVIQGFTEKNLKNQSK